MLRSACLANCFDALAFKILSAVETSPRRSNQHEINAIRPIVQMFGEPQGCEKLNIPCSYIYADDDSVISHPGVLTLYDARAKGRELGRTDRSEYRMYYRTNDATLRMEEGDLLFIAHRKKSDTPAVFAIVDKDSDALPWLKWLFGYTEQQKTSFSGVDSDILINRELPARAYELFFAMGLDVPQNDDFLDEMIVRFKGILPSTAEFSSYARLISGCPNAGEMQFGTADDLLYYWYNTETKLFLSFEKYLLDEEINRGLSAERFISLSKTFLNRRKARAGQSLENHIEQIFIDRNIAYSRTPVTEGKSRPDYIFPSIEAYRDPGFPSVRLYMLGVKTTCKDRWRQILTEAARIKTKHLLTIEPGISENQTMEMKQQGVRLVLPRCLHSSFLDNQKEWIMGVEDFLKVVSY